MFRPKFVPGDGHNVLEYKHNHLHAAARMAKRDVTTINGQVISVVYMTAEPTFTGVIGGYTTSDDSPSSTTASSSSSRTFPVAATATAPPSSPSSTASTTSNSIDDGSAVSSTSSSAYSQSTSTASSSSISASSSLNPGTTTHASSASSTGATTADSSNNSASSSTDSGLSNAGKAGLAIGVILAIGAVLGLILFLLSKKKRQVKAKQARQDAEKDAAIASARAPSTPVNAPRLSLRPASSFLPEFVGGARPKSRLSQNMLGGSLNEPNPMKEKYLATPSAGQQAIPMTEKSAPVENPFKDPENPFVDPERSAMRPQPQPQPQPRAPAPAPVVMPEPQVAPVSVPMSVPVPAPAPIAMPPPVSDGSSDKIVVAVASAGAAAAAQAIVRGDDPPRQTPVGLGIAGPEPVEMQSPTVAMPALLETPKPAVAAASPATFDGQVYRILIDFAPSMEDELELKAGQVVRILHEYDDGWCLCTRLDRSQQGVVPRTCLAAKPSKPRPAPAQRPMSPAMGPPGAKGRPMSSASRQGPQSQGRSMSPSMGRPASPGPQLQGMAMSPRPRNMRLPVNVRAMSPGAYNQPPRPLSPGPRSQQKRSMSPGPYGHAGRPPPMAQSRRRSNSSSQTARDVRDRRQSPPGPSPLGVAVPGMAI